MTLWVSLKSQNKIALEQRAIALVDADSQATSSTWINNLEDNIPRPQIYRLTEPDPLLIV